MVTTGITGPNRMMVSTECVDAFMALSGLRD
jgi:hypothetical protein